VQRLEVAPGRFAAVEGAALYLEAIVLGRTEHAHARDRVIAREDHDLHALGRCRRAGGLTGAFGCVVEGQQLLDQREGYAGLGRHVQAFQLQLHVGRVFFDAGRWLGCHAGFKDLVFFFEIKQRAR
jgi:hypothetical protein